MSASVHGVYPRQRSAESDNASQGAGQPDAKRLKSLDTQRAFRARKAAHVKDLEVKVALQDIELARLRRENDALRMQVDVLQKKTTSSIATETKSRTAGCCTKKDPVQTITKPLSNGTDHSNALLQHSQNRSQPVVRGVDLVHTALSSDDNHQTISPTPIYQHRKETASAVDNHRPTYSTSSLPVVSIGMISSGAAAREPSASPLPTSVSTVSQQSNSPTTTPNSTSTAASTPIQHPPPTSTPKHSVEPVIVSQNTAQITRVVCCNGMFRCEDGDESDTRWVKENTGIKGIGSNTVDDFYSLFGDTIATTTGTTTYEVDDNKEEPKS